MSTIEHLLDSMSRARIATDAKDWREAAAHERCVIDAAYAVAMEAAERMVAMYGHVESETNGAASELASLIQHGASLATVEREMIRNALKRNNDNRGEAAKELGIGERTMYRKINEYELNGGRQ